MTLIEEDVPMASYNTLGVGGLSKFFARITSIYDIEKAVSFAEEKKLPIVPLGGGSNVLVSDDGVEGVVVKMDTHDEQWQEIKDKKILLKACAGIVWDDLVERTTQEGLFGLENLSGIPGTVGASPIQNIGSYGAEVSQVIESVEVYDISEKKVFNFSKDKCRFEYRDSIFKKKKGRFVIMSVTFCLSYKGRLSFAYKDIEERIKSSYSPQTPSEMRELIIDIRAKKFPDHNLLGSAGSFFKNPVITQEKFKEIKNRFPQIPFYSVRGEGVKIPLAFILDKVLKMKGVRVGNVGLYGRQPLVVVAYKGATQKEISCFTDDVKNKIKNITGIDIEREVVFLS